MEQTLIGKDFRKRDSVNYPLACFYQVKHIINKLGIKRIDETLLFQRQT